MSVYTEPCINDNDDDEDIYRGDPPHVEVAAGPAPSILTLSSTTTESSSSSSSSSFMGGGRLGAIAAKLELAIARWGRNVRGNSSASSDASSSSSSSSSSCSSIVTLTKSQIARRRRKRTRGASSLRTMRSERDIAARITRMKALEKSREIPREFALYLPPSITLVPAAPTALDPSGKTDRRITWTTSLPLVLHQLGLATRRPGRAHRGRPRGKRPLSVGPSDGERYFERRARTGGSTDEARLAAAAAAVRRGKKGKQRAGVRVKPETILEELQAKPEAWFLDVANPTWADLRAIGKVCCSRVLISNV